MADLTNAGKNNNSAKELAALEASINKGLTSHAAQSDAFKSETNESKSNESKSKK